jgi:TetR/AcrR family transcriptional regulator, regulator of cefoperazone and chloramphenicol sensitivity
VATNPSVTDQETRQRLVEAAARLFAEYGFNNVTVRDICKEAGANVAAVNYYFHDKWGLYREIVQRIIDEAKRMNNLAHQTPAGTPTEERLRHYVRVFLSHMLAEGKESWQGKLMAREMVDPSPGLDLFIQEVIRPNSARVGALVSELTGLPAGDPRVGMCVGSIQTQMVGYANPIAKRMVPNLRFTPELIDALARHVAEFSLAGLRAIAQQKLAWGKQEVKP